MNLQILIALLLALVPGSESRGSVFVLVEYFLRTGNNITYWIILAVLLNFMAVPIVFFFMDYLHEHLMKIRIYKKVIDKYIEIIRRKSDKFEEKFEVWGYVFLILFVGLPFTGSGAFTTSFIVWLLEWDRKKSFVAICLGVLIATVFSLLAAFGFFSGMSFIF